MNLKTLSFGASLAALTLALMVGTDRPAAAQDAVSDPGVEDAAPPAAAPVRRHRTMRATRQSSARPLTVSRRAAPPPAFLDPGPGREFAGPAAYFVAPIQAISTVVEAPFHMLGSVFPPTGDPGTNVLVIVGAPIRAVGDLAQVPFRIVEAPFRVDTPSLF